MQTLTTQQIKANPCLPKKIQLAKKFFPAETKNQFKVSPQALDTPFSVLFLSVYGSCSGASGCICELYIGLRAIIFLA